MEPLCRSPRIVHEELQPVKPTNLVNPRTHRGWPDWIRVNILWCERIAECDVLALCRSSICGQEINATVGVVVGLAKEGGLIIPRAEIRTDEHVTIWVLGRGDRAVCLSVDVGKDDAPFLIRGRGEKMAD